MTNQLQVFKNKQFGQVRTLTIDNEPWFVAIDVCNILDIKNTTQALSRLDEDERTMLNIGRQGNANIVNEYGLYTLILASRKKEAKQFKRWITHEVLPSIRQTGVYITNQTQQNENELINKTLYLMYNNMVELSNQFIELKKEITNIKKNEKPKKKTKKMLPRKSGKRIHI